MIPDARARAAPAGATAAQRDAAGAAADAAAAAPAAGRAAHTASAPAWRQAATYVQRHLDAPLSLQHLAAVASSSPFHLHRAFTRHAGIPLLTYVTLLRLKRASMQLAFARRRSVLRVALDAGYANPESFSRAFRRVLGQPPSAFRRQPDWSRWRARFAFLSPLEPCPMDVRIVDFPETRVACIEHRGSPDTVYDTTRRFIGWRQRNGAPPDRHSTYGVHHDDHRTTAPEDYRLDLCIDFTRPIAPNPEGVVEKVIPGGRCAVLRYVGSREYIPAVDELYLQWLPASGEVLRDYPVFFHYVNLGPDVPDHEMVTDIYLPIR